MRSSSLLLVLSALFFVVGSSFGLDLNDLHSDDDNNNNAWLDFYKGNVAKRKNFGPSDPRSLFAAIYGYKKRLSMPAEVEEEVVPVPRFDYLLGGPRRVAQKRRGLRDPLDPRNLFRAIYGYRKR